MTLLVLISVVMMAVDHRQQHLQGMRATLSVLLYPLQLLVDAPFAFSRYTQSTLSLQRNLIAENSLLKQQQLLNAVKLQQFDALAEENRRLRTLLQSTRKRWIRVMIAEPMAIDFDPSQKKILLNKGSRDGLFRGQPVIDAHGIVGQLTDLSPFTSSAILITDPNHSIPVRINRNGLHTIALGTGDATELEIAHITNSADIRAGDLLVSSGLDQRFPAGYPVAIVTRVIKNLTRQYAQVKAEPTALLENAQEFLLVWHDGESADDPSSHDLTFPAQTQLIEDR
ncbi:MAG: rod shape-determining protein MreC [Gammaproteobacteria bacterium]|nr:rod shape-determining protein MreC [Gammaproteobacteria bacterium]